VVEATAGQDRILNRRECLVNTRLLRESHLGVSKSQLALAAGCRFGDARNQEAGFAMAQLIRSTIRIIPSLLASVLALAPRTLGQDASAQSIAAVLQPFVDRRVLAGAVAVAADSERVLSCDAVGFADVAAGTPLKNDAVFWIASQSKPITATALMMLVDEGKVKLDDPVAKYVPAFRDVWLRADRSKDRVVLKRPAHPITVREILSHTSGLPFKSALEEPTLDRLPLGAAAGSYAMTPLDFEPGTRYQYSNAGINTAGRIIEVASSTSYENFLETRLFAPLGMKDTTFWPSESQLARLAKAYKPGPRGKGLEETPIDQLRYPLSDRSRYPMPAGGLFSTAADLVHFCQMVLNGGQLDGKRYLSQSAVNEMTKRQTAASIEESYGLGWATGGDSFGHGGAFATSMTIDRKRGLITLFLVQHAGFPGDGNKAHGQFEKAVRKRFGAEKR
jgi:CubicO group peptidase (beta-lactamase class C family)